MRRLASRTSSTTSHDVVSSYEMSIGDLMAGLLFIFIITLMVFVLSHQEKVKRALDDLQHSKLVRTEMLQDIRDQLTALGIEVEVDVEHGILHLTENAIHFKSAKASLSEREQEKVRSVATVLADVLPRFAILGGVADTTQTEFSGKLESVFIEGHTDNVPYSRAGSYHDNWELSAARAIYIYRLLIAYEPVLESLINTEAYPLFSISGYGESRPRNRYAEPTPDPANRRIDIRVIMTPPRNDLDVTRMLQSGLQKGGQS